MLSFYAYVVAYQGRPSESKEKFNLEGQGRNMILETPCFHLLVLWYVSGGRGEIPPVYVT